MLSGFGILACLRVAVSAKAGAAFSGYFTHNVKLCANNFEWNKSKNKTLHL